MRGLSRAQLQDRREDEGVESLDCLGQRCPLPVIALARRITEVELGATIRVLADDPAAAVDIPAWCRMRGQEYVGASTVDGAPAYDVRRTA
jgi:tRNA 2-thiouridine synthesizing protein A